MTAVKRRVVLHVQDGDFRFASRVLKQARAALRHGFAERVELLGLALEEGPSMDEPEVGLRIHRAVAPPIARVRGWIPTVWRLCIRWLRFYRAGLHLDCDIVHCHSAGALVPAMALGRYHGVPVVYDAHELESEVGQPRAASMLTFLIERTFIRHAAVILCVSDSIADWYANRFRLSRPCVVRNVPDLHSQSAVAGPNPLRTRFATAADDIVFLYQGALSPGRRIEQLLRVFAMAPSNRHVVFMGYGVLQPMIEEAARCSPNIHFHPAVPPEVVLAHTRGADVGICGVENVCLSYYFSLPNKLFEYLHAGLPLLVPRWPEMSKIVDEYRCGWEVGERDEDWLAAVAGVTMQEVVESARGSRVAAQAFTWDAEAAVLLEAYAEALAHKGGR
jgi:glycosyltransferase involved in cell wall biosynthesis